MPRQRDSDFRGLGLGRSRSSADNRSLFARAKPTSFQPSPTQPRCGPLLESDVRC